MSKHWNPRDVQGGGGRRRRGGPPPGWSRVRRRPWLSAGDVRIMLLGGLFMGLAYAGWGSWPSREAEADPRNVPVPDYWAESKESREILRPQERSVARPSGAETIGAGGTVDVIDGDTFRIDGATIRIADIDTPETAGNCAYESELAARATRRMAALLADGPFELEPVGWRDEDQYGRKLRIVTRGGHSLGDQLVAEGLARTWTGRREPWC